MQKKILVVEDSPDTLELMTVLLELDGFKVVAAENGQVGIDLAKAESPHLIITDINMPLLNGTEMIKLLREIPDFKSTPILALTAYGKDWAGLALHAGGYRVLTMPVEYDLFRDYISSLLE